MRRYLAIICLLTTLLVLGLWILGGWRDIGVYHTGENWTFAVFSNDGALHINFVDDTEISVHSWDVEFATNGMHGRLLLKPPQYPIVYDPKQTSRGDDWKVGGRTRHRITIAYWFILLVIVVVWTANRRLRFHKTRIGFCRHCGYDLRASPDRCPECGVSSPETSKLG